MAFKVQVGPAQIAIRADFADIFEVKSDGIVRRGRTTTSWSDQRQVLRITYSNRDFCREVIVRTGEGDGELAVNTNGRLSFDVALQAGQAWHRCLIYDLADGAKRRPGRREHRSCCCRRCWGCSKTRRAASSMSQ
jgi:hypothetical protein